MNKLFVFAALALLFSCSSEKLEDLFTETTEFPYVTSFEHVPDLSYIEADSPVDYAFLKVLYENTKHDDEGSSDNIIRAFIELDSLRKNNVAEDEIMEKYWEFPYTNFMPLHKFELNSGIEVYTWIVSFSDGNQGPDMMFATLFKEGVAYSCFEIAKNSSYSDSPVWSSTYRESSISKEGQVSMVKKEEYGEYNDDGEDYSESSKTISELNIANGEIELLSEKMSEE